MPKFDDVTLFFVPQKEVCSVEWRRVSSIGGGMFLQVEKRSAGSVWSMRRIN